MPLFLLFVVSPLAMPGKELADCIGSDGRGLAELKGGSSRGFGLG